MAARKGRLARAGEKVSVQDFQGAPVSRLARAGEKGSETPDKAG
jgi:hypothetical protein